MNYIIKGDKIYRKGTLAHFLDKRAISIEEPTAEDLPAVINPFLFVRNYLLKNNCVIIKLKHSEIQYSTALLGLLDELIPAEQYIFIYIDVDDVEEEVKLDGTTEVESYEAVCSNTDVPVAIETSVVATTLGEECE